MQSSIVSVNPQDYDEILNLMRRVICTDITQDQALQDHYIDNVTQNLKGWLIHPKAGCHLKAVQGEIIIGVILIKNFWNLCNLFVASEYQSQGIGKALVKEAIAQCRQYSDEQVIYVNAAANAIPFYKALGFIPRASNKPQPPGVESMRFLL
ncbi:MAG: GNAT family N-acetyltransferase [Cyanobacteria bacterium P01_F01_bin.150]